MGITLKYKKGQTPINEEERDGLLIKIMSQIDRFDASWASIEKREGQSLKQLNFTE